MLLSWVYREIRLDPLSCYRRIDRNVYDTGSFHEFNLSVLLYSIEVLEGSQIEILGKRRSDVMIVDSIAFLYDNAIHKEIEIDNSQSEKAKQFVSSVFGRLHEAD